MALGAARRKKIGTWGADFGVTSAPQVPCLGGSRGGLWPNEHGGARRRNGKKLVAFTTFNGNTWKRHDELLNHEMTERMAAQ